MTVSPAWMRRTGDWALSYQPHCVVSSVAGSTCVVFCDGTAISAVSSGPREFDSASGFSGGAGVVTVGLDGGGLADDVAGAGCCASVADASSTMPHAALAHEK